MRYPTTKEFVIFPHMGWSCPFCKSPFSVIFNRCPYCMTESKYPSMKFIAPKIVKAVEPLKKLRKPRKKKE